MAQQNVSTSMQRGSESLPSRRREAGSRSPWEDISEMHRQMDNFFTRAFGFSPHSALFGPEMPEGPDVEMYEQGDNIVVEAAVPGFTNNDIKVEATPDSIHIEGERKSESHDGHRHHRRSHWSGFTRFDTTFPLPMEIDPNRVDAKLENGVLKLALPKSEQARQKSVAVSVKGT